MHSHHPRSVNRWILAGCLATLALTLSAAPQKLNLFIWSEYIDPEVVAEFERLHECKVNLDLYEDSESMLAKLQNAGPGAYDLVVPTDSFVPVLIKQKLLAPLRPENLPNLRNLDARFLNPAYDPGNRYTVAYQWGTVGILVRRKEGAPVPDSWGVLFDPQQQAGTFMLMDSMRDTLGAALKYKGYSVNATDPAQLKEARDLLIETKRRSVGFDGSVGVKNKILGRMAQCGIVYSGEGVRAAAEDSSLVYVVPREGGIVWVDNLAVLAGAPHRDLAEKFINHLLDAKVGAQISRFTQFSTPNRASREHLRAEDLNNPAVYPPAETMARLEFQLDLGPKLRLHDEVWTQVKAK
jgi:spermidine/putrescine transport system substrate-binding protein